ncbi:hypothetical protein GVAV_000248 [Gurleya vavrai]
MKKFCVIFDIIFITCIIQNKPKSRNINIVEFSNIEHNCPIKNFKVTAFDLKYIKEQNQKFFIKLKVKFESECKDLIIFNKIDIHANLKKLYHDKAKEYVKYFLKEMYKQLLVDTQIGDKSMALFCCDIWNNKCKTLEEELEDKVKCFFNYIYYSEIKNVDLHSKITELQNLYDNLKNFNLCCFQNPQKKHVNTTSEKSEVIDYDNYKAILIGKLIVDITHLLFIEIQILTEAIYDQVIEEVFK